jgi:hypothetical protein
MPNARAAFDRIAQAEVPKYNRTLEEYAVGKIGPAKQGPELMWTGLPVLVPYLQPVVDHGRSYLHGGIFPLATPPTNTAPPQLFEQLTSRSNLLYYDWEITQARLEQLRPLMQVAGVFLTLPALSTNSISYKWLDAIEPRLGNAVTEVAVVSPKELTVQRTAHVGLTGLELLGLAYWLDNTNFPQVNLNLGFRPVIRSSNPKPRH